MQSFFEQSMGGSDKSVTGHLLFQRPNLFLMEISPPVSQSITSDGESLWTYDKDLEQVVVKDLKNSLSGMLKCYSISKCSTMLPKAFQNAPKCSKML